MKDCYNREITNLRISLTQRCNLRCFYCHREGQSSAGEELRSQEIKRIVEVARQVGISKVKLTGGEPLLRQDIVEIVEAISPLMRDVSITTNGTLLKEFSKDLKGAGLNRVNISLDSLNPEIYKKIVGKDILQDAIDGICSAVDAGLNPVKINMVIMKNLNDNEIDEMISFAKDKKVILQLIELETRREYESNGIYKKYHHDLRSIEKSLRERAVRIERREMHNRMKYYIPNPVEVVRPMHNTEFCRNCTRLRITSDGRLKPCLLSENGYVELSSLLRKNEGDERLRNAFVKAIMSREPYWV